jgi:RNA polymerase primary sigma factor
MTDAVGYWLQAAGRQPLLTAAEEVHLGSLVRAWQDHPAGPDQAPAAVQRRGRRARDRIVAANLRLVAHVVRILRPNLRLVTDADIPDLMQSGALGLVRAAERFDPARGYKFSTFGYWWIRQGINRWCDTSSRTIRPPSTHAGKLARLGRISSHLSQRLGRQPTRAELAAELGMKLEDLDLVLLTDLPCRSLDALCDAENPSALIDLLPAATPGDDEQVDELRRRLATLAPTAAELVSDYWGIDGEPLRIGIAAAKVGLTVHQAKAALQAAELQLRSKPAPKDDVLAVPVQLSFGLSIPTPPGSQQPRSGGGRRGRAG